MAPSVALQCLTVEGGGQPGKPEYPAAAFKRREGGEVKVELVFAAPDQPPEVRLLDDNALPSLVDAVRRHVERLRVPCKPPATEPARLVQEFVFVPNDGRTVMPMQVRDAADAQQTRMFQCLQYITPGARPVYPLGPLSRGEEGKFLARLSFDSATRAPSVTYLAEARGGTFKHAIEDYVQGYRLPCHSAGIAQVDILFTFVIEDGQRTIVRNLSLVQALRAARDLDTPVAFDFSAMGCPFDVQITYMRPFKPSRVHELGSSHPARSPLLDWLSRLTLDLDPRNNVAVLGDKFTVSVPCGKLDL